MRGHHASLGIMLSGKTLQPAALQWATVSSWPPLIADWNSAVRYVTVRLLASSGGNAGASLRCGSLVGSQFDGNALTFCQLKAKISFTLCAMKYACKFFPYLERTEENVI